MTTRLRNLFATFAILFTLTGGLLVFPHVVDAQADNLEAVAEDSGLGDASLEVTIAKIIRTILGLLGVIAVIIVLWGGFVWMTAGGGAEKVDKAKKILINGVIGLAIVLMSYAIATFVLNAILGASSGTSGSSSGGDGDSSLGGGSSVTSFSVQDFSPEGEVSIRNIKVQITFSRMVEEDTVSGNVTITNTSTGEEVDGTLSVSGNKVSFVPSAACPEPNDDRFCFDKNTEFRVEVGEDIKSTSGLSLVCTSDSCTSSFTSGEIVDVDDPEAELTYPDNNDRISIDASTLVQVTATDDSEVATADFYDDNEEIFDSVGAEGDDLSDVTIETTYYTTDLEAGTKYTIEVIVEDIAGNTDSDSINILATAAHCFNEEEDEDEEGEDCGGDDCGACDGSSCEEDSDCSSGTCLEGVCVSYPEIESISPEDGAEGTYVTISGSGFGGAEGTIYFDDGSGGTVEAEIPNCGNGWDDEEIIVEVPEGAGDGPITLITSNDYEETTDDDNGAVVSDFDVNETERPNLCDLSEDTGEITSALTLEGTNFGDEQGDAMIIFTDEEDNEFEAGSYTSWSAIEAAITVPSVTVNEYYDVSIVVDGNESNTMSFGVIDNTDAVPTISSIDPEEGGIGQYVTITGTNFGGSVGNVWFENSSLGTAQGSVDFPDACSEDYWGSEQIIVIVPETFTNTNDVEAGDYSLYVETQGGDESERVDFTITSDDPTPGVCLIDPSKGEAGDSVIIYGDNFGSDDGTVEFYDGARASIATDGWSNDEITVTVPTDAVTGPMSVFNSDGEESNATNFAISSEDEGDGENISGAAYSWYFGTGTIPEIPDIVMECSDDTISGVPNEDFTDEVCVNASIRATFTEVMNTDFLTTDYIKVYSCEDEDCESTSIFTTNEPSTSSSTTATSFTMTHSGFEANTRYLVVIDSDVESKKDGVQMDSDVQWEFVTGSSTDDCDVAEVLISPSTATIEDEGGTTEYEALPTVNCQVLDGTSYTWTWSLGSSSYATLTEGMCEDASLDDSCAVATALAEGEDTVTAQEDDSGVDDDAELIIDYSDPYVTDYWPSCQTACVNSALGASFNIKMDDSIEDPGMVTLYKCDNELCIGLTEVATTTTCIDSDNCDEIALTITESGWDAQLVADTFFRVVISGRVTSQSGVELVQTNYGDDYSWTFATRDDASLCSVDRLELTPDGYTAEAIGERVEYFVQPYGEQDECSVTGQKLSAYSYDYDWTDPIVDDADVAEWILINTSFFDVNKEGISAGCTESCLATGSESYTSVCGADGDGDGNLLDDGEDCDDGNVASGDGCSSTCLAEGTDSCSYTCAVSGDTCSSDDDCTETCDIKDDAEEGTCSISGDTCSDDADCTTVDTCEASGSGCCGDGTRDYDPSTGAGEECDDGNITDGDGCSSSCLNEGSTAAGATCGNGNIGYSDSTGGEDCDDSNRSSGDGCSSICLNEGSIAVTSIEAECGDGIITAPYETCDDGGTTNGDGCSSSCLREGSAGSYGTCGDGLTDQGPNGEGEDCDGEEGCSDDCLWEGSSVSYTSPSVCGDGEAGLGEYAVCEDSTYSSGGDENIDPLQVVEIVDSAAEMVDVESRVAETTIEVTYEDVSTSTPLYLSCVAEVDSDCDSGYGPAENSCCMARPTVDLYPNGGQACRNAAIYGLFSEKMDMGSFFYTDEDSGEDVSNMYLVLDTSSRSCPSSHEIIAHAETATVGVSALARIFYRVSALFGTGVVQAQTSGDCVVPITSVSQNVTEDGTYQVVFSYDTLLEASADYTIHILGDDLTDTDVDRSGVLSFYGVEMDGDSSQDFTTYDELCEMDLVEVEDVDEDSPGVYTKVEEDHDYLAAAYSYTTGSKQQIEPISSVYDWEWTTWKTDDSSEEILSQQSESSNSDGTSNANYQAAGENGDVSITATATISTDVQGETAGESHSGTTDAVAIVCENPWPALDNFPFIDDSTGTGAGAKFGVGWMNFSTYFCRDDGADGTDDDYPDVEVVLTEDIETKDVIKEYFFRLTQDGEATGDAIGIRIARNSDYLSPEAWYAAQGFDGVPSAFEDLGYPAVQAGRTAYIAFPNRASGNMYPNMFIISYNAGAAQETIDIYNQLVSNLAFSTNMNDTALCIDSSGSYTDDVCVSDQDCDWSNNESCADQVSKVRRDMQRLVDITDLAALIDDYGELHGYCEDTTSQTCTEDSQCPDNETCLPATPQLASGTFVRSLSSSAWSSWEQEFATELGETPPSDPLNAYVNCGEDGVYTDYDAQTCVNQITGEYLCPNRETNVYHYRAYGKGGYYIGAELEYFGNPWSADIDDDTSDDQIIKIFSKAGGGDGFVYPSYFCDNTRWGSETTCGDGVLGGSEVCEVGQAIDAELCDSDTSVDSDGDGTVDNDEDGSIAQVCADDCLSTEDDDGATCEAFECGNGVIDSGEECDDGSYNGSYGFCDDDCTYDATFSCGDGSLAGGELCDCGSSGTASGLTYGGSSCSNLNGTYDSNPNNTCAWDCSGPASYCGDGVVDEGSGEVCDGNTDSYDGALCVGGSEEGSACDEDSDCDGSGAVCGDASSPWSEACETTTVCLAGDESLIGYPCTSNAYCDSSDGGDGECSTSTFPTTRTITCADDGEGGEACSWNSPWSTTSFWKGVNCKASSNCGNGVVDEGEECDDGNDDSTDGCTTECQENVCGDGYLYDGEEQCDEGADNGNVCEASYGSTCSYCNESCVTVTYSGAFCGNNVIEGSERCDGTDLPYWYAQYTDIDGTLDPEGNINGICDREDEGDVIYDDPDNPTEIYVCSNVGVCNGGGNNGLICQDDTDCESDDGDGVCVNPACADDCESTCPFTYENDQLLMETNRLGASRATEIELLSYDAETAGTLLSTGNSATIYFPACTAATKLTADVEYNFDRPDTRVIFVTDLSGSMQYVWDGTCADDGSSCHLDSTCNEDGTVECEGEDRMDTTVEALQDSIEGLYEGLGSNVEIGFIGFTNYMQEDDGDDDDLEAIDYVYVSKDSSGDFFFVEDDSADAKSEVSTYVANSGTYTYYGLKAAIQAFEDYSSTDDRQIVVLMTDGNWNCENCGSSQIDPALAACQLKEDGVELYTVALYSGSESDINTDAEHCENYKNDDGTWMDEDDYWDSLCGNGIIDGDEECDDGNSDDNDACSNSCTSAVCGDGITQSSNGEECDDGGESSTCDNDCTIASCGDGTINTTAGETCDGDTGSDTSRCSSSCVLSVECCSAYYTDYGADCWVEGTLSDTSTTCSACSSTCSSSATSVSGSCNNDGNCDVGEDSSSCPLDCGAEYQMPYSPWISPVRIAANEKTSKIMTVVRQMALSFRDAVTVPYVSAETCEDDYGDMGLIDQMACWSSGNPSEDNDVDYAYNGSSASELAAMYEEIIDSIVSIRFTYVVDGSTVSGNVQEGENVELPWPEGFECDGENAQEVPLRISFEADDEENGTVVLSDMRFRYCEP